MIVFVIHDAVCSENKIMFAESVEAWLASCRKKDGPVFFDKRGEIDIDDEDFGHLYILNHWDIREAPQDVPQDLSGFRKMCKEKGWDVYEPSYVQAYTVTPELVLDLGN